MNFEKKRPSKPRKSEERAPSPAEQLCAPSKNHANDQADGQTDGQPHEELPGFPVSPPPAPWPRIFPGL